MSSYAISNYTNMQWNKKDHEEFLKYGASDYYGDAMLAFAARWNMPPPIIDGGTIDIECEVVEPKKLNP